MAAAVSALKSALDAGESGEESQDAAIVEAIHGAAEIPDAAVVPLLVRAMKDSSRAVESAAIEALERLHRARSTAIITASLEALGYMPMKEAVKALNDLYLRYSQLRDDEYLLPVLLKAIGRHGDPSSVAVL